MTAVLSLNSITKRFGSLVANDSISFELARGEVLALLGENGAGKTTLMNILFGHYVADEGSIEAFGRPLTPGDPRAALEAGIGMVHQHFTLAENMTVLDNIVLGTRPNWRLSLDSTTAARRVERLSRDFGLEVAPERLVSTLTVGERQRVEILKALYRDARVLILDEPTAVLTPFETDALFSTLRRLTGEGLSIIFISHKLNEVMAISSRVLVLRGGKVAGERLTASTGTRELAELMVGQELATPSVSAGTPGPVRLRFDAVSTRSALGRRALDRVNLELRGGEITGLAGVSGNGQSAIAALVSGTARPDHGHIEIDGKRMTEWSPAIALSAGVGRVPEDRHASGTIADMTVAENVIAERYRSPPFSRHGILDHAAARRQAQRLIRDYDVKCPSPDARIRLLSGGNMQKLILARALDAQPAVILAAQPTRGLDVGAIAYVQKRLVEARDAGAAILLISEDLDEVLALSDRIHVVFAGRISEPFVRGQKTVRGIAEMMAGHGLEAVA